MRLLNFFTFKDMLKNIRKHLYVFYGSRLKIRISGAYYSSLAAPPKESYGSPRASNASSTRDATSTFLYRNKWEAIIGLELHAQIDSNTKLFSGKFLLS